MSRTTLCLGTASLLVVGTLILMGLRWAVLGAEVKLPTGPNAWKVTLVVCGKAGTDAKLTTSTPLDTPTQHIARERATSGELTAQRNEATNAQRRQYTWTPTAPNTPFRARYECLCTLPNRTNVAPAPTAGEYLGSDPAIDSTHPEIAELARRLTVGRSTPADVADALFAFVDSEIDNQPSMAHESLTAIACLHGGHGDPIGKARLLAALLRNRAIPARLVVGLSLARNDEQSPHVWVEAWAREQWVPMCPFYHHYGHVPHTYLVFGYDDPRVVQGKNIRGLEYGFLVEKASATAGTDTGWLRQLFIATSPYSLPPAEQRLVAFLLLLPVGALIVCLFRNVVGVYTFGTFAPALVGLAFRELRSLPGILVFTSILLIGWLLRRTLNRFHLLQVPRSALMLSLVVLLLCGFVISAHAFNLSASHYISLFPLVILTGMIERFWTLEEEDGTTASFRTLFLTIGIAGVIGAILSLHAVQQHLFRFPETIGLVMAAQLLLGRYTGYRLTELYRFHDMLPPQEEEPATIISGRFSVGNGRF